MGIEQIQSAKIKALLPAFQFNWSQMESTFLLSTSGGPKIPKWGIHEKNISTQDSQNASFPSLRDEYLKSLAIKGFSENTLRVREIYIRLFLRWCEQNQIARASEVTNEVLSRFQEHLFFQRKMDGQPLCISSQYSRLALIRTWFRWMHRHGHIPDDPTIALELPRTAFKLPTVLTKLQMERVLAQPDVRRSVGIRDRVSTRKTSGRLITGGRSVW